MEKKLIIRGDWKRKSLLGLGLAWGVVFLIVLTYHLAYWGKIYPGVKLGGIAVGNQTREEAKEEIEELIEEARKKQKKLVVKDDSQKEEIDLEAMGLEYRVEESVEKAWEWGREKNWWQGLREKSLAWRKGVEIGLEFGLNETLFQERMASLSAEIYVPAIEPTIEIREEEPRVRVTPGKVGRKMEGRIFRALFYQRLATLDLTPLKLPVEEISPVLTEGEMEVLRKAAEGLLGKKLKLVLKEKEWELQEEELISFLDFKGGFDQFKILLYVSELARSVNQLPANASFQFENGRVREFKPAKLGQTLDETEMVEKINEYLKEEEKEEEVTMKLPMIYSEPAVMTEDVNDLGIKELVGRGESWFRGSITSRIYNIQLAAGRLNGLLIAPGEVFSFNRSLGDVSEATGFKKAYIIKEGRTILGDGGGVCQVSTTLFRAVLEAGLPILERHAHAYRVSYYEQNSAVGLDATVYDPTADLKFKNDTEAFVLIQTGFDSVNKKLVFDLYGAGDGRVATIGKTRVWDQAPPPPALYQDDPTLPAGTTKQIDWEAWGAKAAFDWRVVRDGEVLQERTFYSNYRPWQAVWLVGTGQ